MLTNAKKRHLQVVMNVESKKWKGHYEPIYFTEEDFRDIEREHDDPMVISTLIHNFLIKRVLIDQESSFDILYFHVAEAMGILKNAYRPHNSMLIGFAGGQVHVEGTVALQVMLSSQLHIKTMEVDFLVVSTHNNACNAILDRPLLNKIGVIIFTPHSLMKYPTNQGTGQVRADQQMARPYMASLIKSKKVEQSRVDQGMLSGQTLKTCRMIDSTLLDIRSDNKRRPKSKLESKNV